MFSQPHTYVCWALATPATNASLGIYMVLAEHFTAVSTMGRSTNNLGRSGPDKRSKNFGVERVAIQMGGEKFPFQLKTVHFRWVTT